MANIITFKKQPEKVWRYSYWIYVNGQYSGYIGRCNHPNSKPFIYSLDYCLDFEADSLNELKKLVRQKIKEKLNGTNGI